MKLAGGQHEGEPAPGCDEEEKVATASSLEEEPGGHLNNKHMGQIPRDRENGPNMAFFYSFLCPIKGTSEDLSRSYPVMAVKLGKEVATS